MPPSDQLPFPAEPGERPVEYQRRLTEAPLDPVTLPSGDPAVMAVRFADVREVLAAPAFSRNFRYEGAPRMVAGGVFDGAATSVNNMDPPEHTRLRRLVSGVFTPRRIEQWRPRIRQIAEELLDEATPPPVDLVSAYAFPVPVRVISDLLGVPEADHDLFRAWSDGFLSVSTQTSEERVASYKEFAAYVAALIQRHRENPQDGLVTDLINARDADDALTEPELVRMVCDLITTGYETTANVLSRGVLRLLAHPDQYAALAASPDLVPKAVEEILRYESSGTVGLLRVAKTDADLPSGTVRAGQAVVVSLSAANRDPAKFERPEEFDMSRPDIDHITFGHGAHYCLAANLARTELQEALTALVTRHPGLRLTGDDVPWRTGLMVTSPERLPVTW
jgi:cytochrome P450